MLEAVFFDRDGVINVDYGYVYRTEDFEIVTGFEQFYKLLPNSAKKLIVTNQSGIARGYYTEDQYQELTFAMKQALGDAGAAVEAVYHCPHLPAGTVAGLTVDCDCRKPAPGMIFRAARELNLSLPDSILVGDKPSDIKAARAAGVGKAYIVHSDNADSGPGLAGADAAYVDLYSCVAEFCGF